MKKTTRIVCITLCILLIALSAAGVIWALYSKFANNEAHAEEIENTQTNFVNFNQLQTFTPRPSNIQGITVSVVDNWKIRFVGNYTVQYSAKWRLYYDYVLLNANHKYYFKINSNWYSNLYLVNGDGDGILYDIQGDFIYTDNSNLNVYVAFQLFENNYYDLTCGVNVIDLTLMYGAETANTMTIEQCKQLFTADYYPYNKGTTIDLSGFEQYNAGAMSARESMTINTTSANVADNLDNVVINSSYGSVNKALIQGYMVWGAGDYANCVALFNLETNFNEGDYFEFEFYTITGADSANGLPNINTFYDLQIIAVDSSGNIVPLATVKAQNNPNATTKATFYLPFSTDKLYITTPHKYIIGYNNFKINITTTNLTALSLYSYKDGYREGSSSGYTSGYNAGIAQQNATLGTMGYIQSAFNGIGSILQIELLPNVPFSLFVLLPLMFGLIAFVVKLSKGGS